jgi:hypothetical protein
MSKYDTRDEVGPEKRQTSDNSDPAEDVASSTPDGMVQTTTPSHGREQESVLT